jgi:hypothetical protein
MSKIQIEGIELNENSIDLLNDWQSDSNEGIDLVNETLDSVAYNLANPDMGMDDKERLNLVAGILEFKRQVNSFRKEVCNEHE